MKRPKFEMPGVGARPVDAPTTPRPNPPTPPPDDDDWDQLTESEKRRRTNLNAWDAGYRAGLADGSRMSQNTDPFPTPRGALSPDGVTAGVPGYAGAKGAVLEPQGPTTHRHIAEYPSACTGCEHLAADLANRLPPGLWPSEARRRLDEAEADAVAPPDIDVERLAKALDLSGIGHIDGHLPSIWAEAAAAEYRRLASPDATRREPSGE